MFLLHWNRRLLYETWLFMILGYIWRKPALTYAISVIIYWCWWQWWIWWNRVQTSSVKKVRHQVFGRNLTILTDSRKGVTTNTTSAHIGTSAVDMPVYRRRGRCYTPAYSALHCIYVPPYFCLYLRQILTDFNNSLGHMKIAVHSHFNGWRHWPQAAEGLPSCNSSNASSTSAPALSAAVLRAQPQTYIHIWIFISVGAANNFHFILSPKRKYFQTSFIIIGQKVLRHSY